MNQVRSCPGPTAMAGSARAHLSPRSGTTCRPHLLARDRPRSRTWHQAPPMPAIRVGTSGLPRIFTHLVVSEPVRCSHSRAGQQARHAQALAEDPQSGHGPGRVHLWSKQVQIAESAVRNRRTAALPRPECARA
jgi:hypothetical protein